MVVDYDGPIKRHHNLIEHRAKVVLVQTRWTLLPRERNSYESLVGRLYVTGDIK